MKKFLIVLSMMLAIIVMPMDAASVAHHRYHQTATATQSSANTGVDAYSDTTSYDGDTASVDSNYYSPAYGHDAQSDGDFTLKVLDKVFSGTGLGIVLICCLLILLLPLIIVILLLRYLVKRHNDNVRLEQERINAGYYNQRYGNQTSQDNTGNGTFVDNGAQSQSETQSQSGYNQYDSKSYAPRDIKDTDQWRKGVRNVSVGIGLIFLFWFMGAKDIIGIGVLVACFGAGQMYLGYTAKKDKNDNKNPGEQA